MEVRIEYAGEVCSSEEPSVVVDIGKVDLEINAELIAQTPEYMLYRHEDKFIKVSHGVRYIYNVENKEALEIYLGKETKRVVPIEKAFPEAIVTVNW